MIRDYINRNARRIPEWVLYVLALAPMPYLFWLGLSGELGINPIEELEHEYGLLALQFLIATLCITPLRNFLRINLICFRRALGLIAFAYLLAHLLIWALLDVGSIEQIWGDILERPYITIGMIGFLLLLPLALTSNNFSIRKLGVLRWAKLHQLSYLAILLGVIHFLMLRKGIQLEPLIYLIIIIMLLALRLIPRKRKG